MAKEFCSGVPEKANKYARPITIPGMVFVIYAILSIAPFNFSETLLLAVINAAP